MAAGAFAHVPVLQAQSAGEAGSRPGILVMAHGGIPEWDQAVADAVAPLKTKVPTALALGMADPATMQAAIDSLESQGVGTIAVVRLFLSGESFMHDTEYYLGLREDPPAMPMAMMMSHGQGGHGQHGGHGAHGSDAIRPLSLSAGVLLERRGISDFPFIADIVAERARTVSVDPSRESVIVIAHGMGEEDENQRVLDNMAGSVEALRAIGFRAVRAATLREDWPEVREHAEAEIREWVGTRAAAGDRVIVVPFRLFGFGGYAEVLEGLTYTPADGLLPHPSVTTWIEEAAGSLFCAGGVRNPLAECR